MTASLLVCGAVLDGVSEELAGRTEIRVRNGGIAEVGHSVQRPADVDVIDLSERTTVDLRNALDAELVLGPGLIVAGHIISASAGHGDPRGFYAPRWELPVPALADSVAEIRRLVRREHVFGSDWIKTANAGGYFRVGDDPARPTWFDEEMEARCSTAELLGMPVAVHTGAADGCKQAIRFGARSLEHAYLIDEEAVDMATATTPTSFRPCR